MTCTPDNTCVHQLAAGLITVADFCPTCTSFLIARHGVGARAAGLAPEVPEARHAGAEMTRRVLRIRQQGPVSRPLSALPTELHRALPYRNREGMVAGLEPATVRQSTRSPASSTGCGA